MKGLLPYVAKKCIYDTWQFSVLLSTVMPFGGHTGQSHKFPITQKDRHRVGSRPDAQLFLSSRLCLHLNLFAQSKGKQIKWMKRYTFVGVFILGSQVVVWYILRLYDTVLHYVSMTSFLWNVSIINMLLFNCQTMVAILFVS